MNIATTFTPKKIPTKDVSLDDKYISDNGTAYMTGIKLWCVYHSLKPAVIVKMVTILLGLFQVIADHLLVTMIIFFGKLKEF